MEIQIVDGVAYIDDAPIRYPHEVHAKEVDLAEETWHVRGVRLICENGWSLSMIWSDGSYTSNRFTTVDRKPFQERMDHVEIAAISPNGVLTDFESDTPGDDWHETVKGWVPLEEALHFYQEISKYPSEEMTCQNMQTSESESD